MTLILNPPKAIKDMQRTDVGEIFNIDMLLDDIRELYLENATPWVIGYSGGKDSTTVLQMIFYALSKLPPERLNKDIHVICNDTLVENPAIQEYIERQLALIEKAGKERLFCHNSDLFHVHKVHPVLKDRFWFNLIGKGYPSPNRWFRWCTERLKIEPTNQYCQETIQNRGNIIIVLGIRKAESANRAVSMRNHDTGQRLRNHSLPGAFVYAPIQNLSNNEVWAYLLQAPSPWGGNNREILHMYGNACSGGECPFVIEIGTQSCGASRFGCWVCTVVDRDKSMENFVENGDEWMRSLLDFRNWLQVIRQQDSQFVPQRLKGRVRFGGFLLRTRQAILDRLLGIQNEVSVELISPEELALVRELLDFDSQNADGGPSRRFTYDYKGKRLIAVADYDLSKGNKNRLGSLTLKHAKLISTGRAFREHTTSTRIQYYLDEPHEPLQPLRATEEVPCHQ